MQIENMQQGTVVGDVDPEIVAAARENLNNLVVSRPPSAKFEGPMTLEQVRQWIAFIDHKPGREVLEEYLRLKLAPGPRTYTVRRGETLHGICKRLTGDVSPADIVERTYQMARLNGGIQAGALPEGLELKVPESFPLEPRMDHSSAAGQHRVAGLMFSHAEELSNSLEKLRHATDEELSRAWRSERDAISEAASLRRWLYWTATACAAAVAGFISLGVVLWAVL